MTLEFMTLKIWLKTPLLLILLLPLYVNAWGPLGHMASCDAAWRISDKNRQENLSALAKRMGFKTFAESCLWADQIRRDKSYAWAKPLHYMNIGRNDQMLGVPPCSVSYFKFGRPSCVWNAITYYAKRSKDKGLSRRQRDEALLFMSHFILDIHQPLHVAYRDDRGGTRKMVQFEGKLLSLHAVWDSHIIYCGTNKRWRSLGKQLAKSIPTLQQSVSLPNRTEVTRWAEESFTLTQLIYKHSGKILTKDYCRQFHPLAIKRLELASERLYRWLQ